VSKAKKRSKDERREAKAAANRLRAHMSPSFRRRTTRKQSHGTRQERTPPQEVARPESKQSTYQPRCEDHVEFEREFLRFERSIMRSQTEANSTSFSVRDVPRPPAHDVTGAARATSEQEWRHAWQRGLLLWHPDKWSERLRRVDDPDKLDELTRSMTRAVLRVKDRGYTA